MNTIYGYPAALPTTAHEERCKLPKLDPPIEYSLRVATPEELQRCLRDPSADPDPDLKDSLGRLIAKTFYKIPGLCTLDEEIEVTEERIKNAIQRELCPNDRIIVEIGQQETDGFEIAVIGNHRWQLQLALDPSKHIAYHTPLQSRQSLFRDPLSNIVLAINGSPIRDSALENILGITWAYFNSSSPTQKADAIRSELLWKLIEGVRNDFSIAYKQHLMREYEYLPELQDDGRFRRPVRRDQKELITLVQETIDNFFEEVENDFQEKIKDSYNKYEQGLEYFGLLHRAIYRTIRDNHLAETKTFFDFVQDLHFTGVVLEGNPFYSFQSISSTSTYQRMPRFRNLVDTQLQIAITNSAVVCAKIFQPEIDDKKLFDTIIESGQKRFKSLDERLKHTLQLFQSNKEVSDSLRPRLSPQSFVPLDWVDEVKYEKSTLDVCYWGSKLLDSVRGLQNTDKITDEDKQTFSHILFNVCNANFAFLEQSDVQKLAGFRIREISELFISLAFYGPYVEMDPKLLGLISEYAEEFLQAVGPYQKELSVDENIDFWRALPRSSAQQPTKSRRDYEDSYSEIQVAVEGVIANLLMSKPPKDLTPKFGNGAKNGNHKVGAHALSDEELVERAKARIREIGENYVPLKPDEHEGQTKLNDEEIKKILIQAYRGFFASKNEIRTTFGNDGTTLNDRQRALLDKLNDALFKEPDPIPEIREETSTTPPLDQITLPKPEPVIAPSFLETFLTDKGFSTETIQSLLAQHPRLGKLKSDQITPEIAERAELFFKIFTPSEISTLLGRLPDFWNLTLQGTYDEDSLRFAKVHFARVTAKETILRAAKYRPVIWSHSESKENGVDLEAPVSSPEQTIIARQNLLRTNKRNIILQVLAMPDKSGFNEAMDLLEAIGCSDEEIFKIIGQNPDVMRPHVQGTPTVGEFYFSTFEGVMNSLGITENQKLGKTTDERIKHFLLDCPTALRPTITSNVASLRRIFIENGLEPTTENGKLIDPLSESVYHCKKLVTLDETQIRTLLDKTEARLAAHKIYVTRAALLHDAPHIMFSLSDNEVRTESLLSTAEKAIANDRYVFKIQKLQQLFTLNPIVAEVVAEQIEANGATPGLDYYVERIDKTQKCFIERERMFGNKTIQIIEAMRKGRDEVEVRNAIREAYRDAFGEIRQTPDPVI